MTELQADPAPTTHLTHPRRWIQVLGAGILTAAAVIATAGTANAAGITRYHVAGSGSSGSAVVSDPTAANATTIATLPDGTTFTVDCGIRGRSVKGNTVWHHITAPVVGYLADYYTNTPGFNQLITGEAGCVYPMAYGDGRQRRGSRNRPRRLGGTGLRRSHLRRRDERSHRLRRHPPVDHHSGRHGPLHLRSLTG
jgi:hypothetical protein